MRLQRRGLLTPDLGVVRKLTWGEGGQRQSISALSQGHLWDVGGEERSLNSTESHLKPSFKSKEGLQAPVRALASSSSSRALVLG